MLLCYECYIRTSVISQAAVSALDILFLAVAAGRLLVVQSLLGGGMCKVNDENEVCTSRGS